MNFINDLHDIMREASVESFLSIAQEAEDITSQVELEAADATGNKKQVGEDIDLNTDDILGTKTSDNKTEDTSDTDPDDTPGDTGGDNSMNVDENEKDQPDEMTDDQMDDKMNEMSDPFETSQKKKMWRQFKSLNETFRDSINLITKYVPNVSDAPTIKAMDSIKENLVTGKDLIYKILTEEYEGMSYPEMQKRYIGLSNVYDILSQELDEYFNNRKKELKS